MISGASMGAVVRPPPQRAKSDAAGPVLASLLARLRGGAAAHNGREPSPFPERKGGLGEELSQPWEPSLWEGS